MGLLASPAVDQFTEWDAIVTTGRQFYKAPTSVYGNMTSVIDANTNYQRTTEKPLFLESEHQHPEIEIASIYDSSIEGKVEDTEFELNSNDEFSTSLETREATVAQDNAGQNSDKKPKIGGERKTKTIEITPMVKIRNNGSIQVYGKKGYYILPINRDDPVAKSIEKAFRGRPNSQKKQRNGSDLLVFKTEDK